MKGEKILVKDINNGINHFVDGNYHGMGGSSLHSVKFWNVIKKHIQPIKKAEIVFTPQYFKVGNSYEMVKVANSYRMILTTWDNKRIILKGCSSGYFGQGSRSSVDILTDAGFNRKRLEKLIFTHGNDNVTIYRRKKPNKAYNKDHIYG